MWRRKRRFALKPYVNIHPMISTGKGVRFQRCTVEQNASIGDYSTISSGAYIGKDVSIGKDCFVAPNAVLHKGTILDDNSIFGTLSCCEGYSYIGSNVLIQSQIHITKCAVIEDCVFMGPMSGIINDHDMLHERRQVKPFVPDASHIQFGARIGFGAKINPGVTIGREAVIGTGSVVTKDVPEFAVAYGVPARVHKDVDKKWWLPDTKYEAFQKRVGDTDTLKQGLLKAAGY